LYRQNNIKFFDISRYSTISRYSW